MHKLTQAPKQPRTGGMGEIASMRAAGPALSDHSTIIINLLIGSQNMSDIFRTLLSLL